MKRFLTLLALIAILLVGCVARETGTPQPTEAPFVSFNLFIVCDGTENGDGTYGNVTTVQATTDGDILYYQSWIEGTKVHSGVDYDLDGQPDVFADANLVTGATLFLYDPDGNFYGELLLLEDGTVMWTPPADAEFVPPTTPLAPSNAG